MNRLWLPVVAVLAWCGAAFAESLPDFTDLVEKQSQTVVNISTSQTVKGSGAMPNVPEDDPMFDFFRRFMPQPPGGGNRDYESRSLGSGFIVSSDGYVLTNSHVVQAADEITVTLKDKREYKARVIGSDRRTDVAVLKIDATGLQPVVLGDPNRLRVGEWVVAIGSPFGFESTVTKGIVSAKGRSLPQENYVPFIQTDVPINPGNSGGPLFNMKGEVVGINSQIYSRTGGFMGLSFAIPIDVAMEVSDQLRKSGKVSRGWLGVVIQEVTKDLADSFGMPKASGALVASVEKGGPADKAGVEASDIILKFDGKLVGSSSDLPRLVGSTKPGSKVSLQVWRKGAQKELTLAVGELPQEKVAATKPTSKKGKGPDSANKLGLALSELTSEQRKELQVSGGLLVEDVQGPAARAGIQPGDVILSLNNNELKTVEQFQQALSHLESRRNVAVLVKRGDSTQFVTIKLEGQG
jgi:serine protease Do